MREYKLTTDRFFFSQSRDLGGTRARAFFPSLSNNSFGCMGAGLGGIKLINIYRFAFELILFSSDDRNDKLSFCSVE